MNGEIPIARRIDFMLLACSCAIVAERWWTSFCAFPLSGWNATRLAPSFMLRHGVSPYPGLDGGAVTTWIYGPIPLLLQFPATLAGNTSLALLIAAAINLLIAAIPIGLTIFALRSTSLIDRAWAGLLCFSLWPNSSLQYLQADNVAVALGLTANFLLMRPRESSAHPPIAAAVFTALAVWSKQTSIGLVFAQLIWLGFTAGRSALWRHGLACAGVGILLGLGSIAWFGFDGLWLNLVQLPIRLPYSPAPLGRILEHWPHFLGYIILPALCGALARRSICQRQSLWFLPFLSWLCLLPGGIASILKIGGTANSLTGILYLMPLASWACVTWFRDRARRTTFIPMIAVGSAVAVQMVFAPIRPHLPMLGHLRRADYLAKEFPAQIYFPWNPLVTFFSDQRFYHAEDGLFVRYVAQVAPSQATTARGLPPNWCVTAYHNWPSGWGIIEQMEPRDAQRTAFGDWMLHSWPVIK